MSETPIGIVVTRNEWGPLLVEEVEGTYCDCGLYAVIVNPASPELIRPVAIAPDQSIFWFVDAPGSTAERAAQRVKLAIDHIITGFSMPMLLSFVTKRKHLPIEVLVAQCRSALERGNICG